MKTIYKYQFNIKDLVGIPMCDGAKILKVECQNDIPSLWALVDNDRPIITSVFWILGTGHPIDPRDQRLGEHVGTFQQGPFVWHMFHAL